MLPSLLGRAEHVPSAHGQLGSYTIAPLAPLKAENPEDWYGCPRDRYCEFKDYPQE
jgi:hypothetical protein